jgi:AcrR family transcriptional regulator
MPSPKFDQAKSPKSKDDTKRRLIQAVGEKINSDGIYGMKISHIAKLAQVDRKLIYRYFGSLNNLIEAYVLENDYWMIYAENMKKMIRENGYPGSQELITAVLQNQFKYFMSEQDMQKLILLELSTNSSLMKSIHNVRESMGQEFLELSDKHFQGSKKVNFRAIAALLVGGIYYTILHTMYNGGRFTDIDILSEDGQNEILKAIEQIVGWAFQEK